MPISFIPVTSQNEIIQNSKNSAKLKGDTLKKISSGKKYDKFKDGVAESVTMSSFQSSINECSDLLKNISLYTSMLEYSVEANNLLRENYENLRNALIESPSPNNVVSDYFHGYSGEKNARDMRQSEINFFVNSIKNIINNSEFLGGKVFQKTDRSIENPLTTQRINFSMLAIDDFFVTLQNVDLAMYITEYSGNLSTDTSRYDGDSNDLEKLFSDDDLFQNFLKQSFQLTENDVEKISNSIKSALTKTNATDAKNAALLEIATLNTDLKNELTDRINNAESLTGANQKTISEAISNFLRENSLTRDNIIAAIDKTMDNLLSNYNEKLFVLASIDSSEKFLSIKRNNIQAALSSVEDIDIQEEMMDLMNEEILAELSSESLVRIKESSKYILKLIQS